MSLKRPSVTPTAHSCPRWKPTFSDVASRTPFTWEVEFPDIFDPRTSADGQGFSAVIGNPPYYNADATFGRQAEELAWLAAAFPQVYTDKTDILFYFFARGVEVLRKGGSLGFIVSRSFLQGDKSLKLREFLASSSRLDHLFDFLGGRVFDAGIATAVLVLSKVEPPGNHSLIADYALDFDAVHAEMVQGNDNQLGMERVTVPQSELLDGNWTLSPFRNTVFATIDAHPKLQELVAEVGKGMETARNDIFEVDSSTLNRLGLSTSSSLVKPRASNTNLHEYGVVPLDKYVLWLEDTEFEDLPTGVQGYLNEHRDELEKRAAFRRGNCRWYRFTFPLHADKHFGPKLMHSYRGHANQFVVDRDGKWLGLTNTTHVFLDDSSPDPYALAALLNSEVATFRMTALGGLAKQTGPRMFEYFDNQLAKLPAPRLTDKQEEELAELGRDAHEAFHLVRSIHEAFLAEFGSQPHTLSSLHRYVDPTGPYGTIVDSRSPNPNAVGHLIELEVSPSATGFAMVGRVTSDENWREGDRIAMGHANIESSHVELYHLLFHRAHHLASIDPEFQARHKLSHGGVGNLYGFALDAVTVPVFDEDPVRNLKMIETLTKRVAKSVGTSDLGASLRRLSKVKDAINEKAYEAYGVAASKHEIKAALAAIV